MTNSVRKFQPVTIVDNLTMEPVVSGKILHYTKDEILVQRFNRKIVQLDARVHHIQGQEPKRMLVWKDEVLKTGEGI